MNAPGSRSRAAALAAALLASIAFGARAAAPLAELTLQSATDIGARSVYDAFSRRFVVWISWRDIPDSLATFIHPPDTTGWAVTTPSNLVSLPAVKGPYREDPREHRIDRTLSFHAVRGGTVGVDSVVLTYEIRREEYINGRLTLTPSYAPGNWVPLTLRNQRTSTPVDFGLQVRLSAGKVDAPGGFLVGLEDFEGFHVWRGIQKDGRDLEIIGELSKEEGFRGSATGGSLEDSLYYFSVIPTLRTGAPWFSPFGAVQCLGNRIDFPLETDQLFWFDCQAVNGFRYYYAVTTFDRGYSPQSGSQGLVKVDNCAVTQGVPFDCKNEMSSVTIEVDPQDNLYKVYAVPNPFRSGSSRLTADNYHNFPDQYIRFVNVPSNCTIRIFTVSGDMVREMPHTDGSGNVEWDTTNWWGEEVTSGVYVYRVQTPSGDSVYGRITIIR